MELKTLVLDGIEYVLVPRDVFEKNIQPEIEVESSLDDFEKKEEQEAVVVVDTMPGVKKAQGSTYGYAERLKEHKLQPEDVMVLKTNFEDMPELPEIARSDFKHKIPPGKWGFYGPGVERDLG